MNSSLLTEEEFWSRLLRVAEDVAEEREETVKDRTRMHLLFTTQEAASYLGVSVDTMERWRSQDIGPSYISLTGSGHGRSVRYLIEDLAEFLEHYRKGMRKGW